MTKEVIFDFLMQHGNEHCAVAITEDPTGDPWCNHLL